VEVGLHPLYGGVLGILANGSPFYSSKTKIIAHHIKQLITSSFKYLYKLTLIYGRFIYFLLFSC